MAPRRRKVPFLVRFRTPLLLGMLSLIGLFVALLLFGRSGMHSLELTTQSSEPELSSVPEEGVTSRSEGFDYTQYDEGKPIFRVKGATQSVGRDDSARLQDVEIQLFRPDGETFLAHSDRALYQRRISAAELEGNVRLEGASGLKLWTEKLVVGKEGNRIASPEPVRFEYSERIAGSANRLRMELPSRLVLLQGQVKLRAREGGDRLRLEADRGFFEESNRQLRAEGNVRLTHDDDFLEAQRLSAYLEVDQDVLRFLRAKWKVKGRLRLPPQGGGTALPEPLDFSADGASLLLDPSGQHVRKIELEGSERQSAELSAPDTVAGTRRRLTSNYLVGDFEADALGSIQAFGQVHLEELPAGEGDPEETTALRSIRSERAEGTLDAQGSLDLVTMIGSVTYDEPDFQVQSHRARLNLREGLAQFLGNPARLTGEEGDVTARQLVYNRDRDHLVAAGEARVALPPKAGLPGPLMQSGDGPIRVESDEVRWNRDVDRTTFTGNVRAWRGRDLLLAEEMVVDRPTERLQASGKVRTIWHPAPPEEGKSKSAFQSGTLEVSADEFSYLGDEARLRYRGKVEVLDGPRTLRCGRTEIYLDEDDRMRRLECLESAYLSDRSQGRVIEGDRAVHDPVEGKIRVWGSPVKLKDERGSQLQGELVIYDLETENVELGRASEQEAAAEKGAGT